MNPRRVFGIPYLDDLIAEAIEALGMVALLIVMIPLTLVILVLSFVVSIAVGLALAFVLEVVGVPPDAYNPVSGTVGLGGGLVLTFVLSVKAFKRMPVIRKVIAPEPGPDTGGDVAETAARQRRRGATVVLAEVAELDTRFALNDAGVDGRADSSELR